MAAEAASDRYDEIIEVLQPIIGTIETEMKKDQYEIVHETIDFLANKMYVRYLPHTIKIVIVDASNNIILNRIVYDFVIVEAALYTTEDRRCGSEDLTLYEYSIVETEVREKIIADHVGPTLASFPSSVFYTIATNKLAYRTVARYMMHMGNHIVVYIEADTRNNCYLRNCDNGVVLDIENNCVSSRSIYMHPSGTINRTGAMKHKIKEKWLTRDIMLTNRGYGNEYYSLLSVQNKKHIWKGSASKGHIVNAVETTTKGSFLIHTISSAESTVYLYDGSTTLMLMKPTYCKIKLLKDCFIVNSLVEAEYMVDLHGIVSRRAPIPLDIALVRKDARSKDKTRIPVIIAQAATCVEPIGLLVCGYGAYGIPYNMSYPYKWLPLMRRGWAVAFVCVRGGWENGDKWYFDGSLRNRETGREDFHVGILAAQKEMHVTAERTVLYGRSAGGFLVGATANKWPEIANMLFMEAPFLDVLATMMDKTLPLTELEAEEFGAPYNKKADHQILAKLSPVDNVPTDKKFPIVFIRTGADDSQVFPGESEKYIENVNSAGQKLNLYHKDECEGHFVKKDLQETHEAEDAAIILNM